MWFDALKMSGLELEATDVVAALQSQNIQAAIGALGGEEASDYLQLKVDAPGRGAKPEDFEKIIVKTTSDGRQVALGDVARVELGAEAPLQIVRNRLAERRRAQVGGVVSPAVLQAGHGGA